MRNLILNALLIVYLCSLCCFAAHAQVISVQDTVKSGQLPHAHPNARDDEEDSQKDSVTLRTINDAQWKKNVHDKAFVYRRAKEKPPKAPQHRKPLVNLNKIFNARWITYGLYLLVAILVFFVVRKFIVDAIHYKPIQRSSYNNNTVPSDEDIHAISDWEVQLRKALEKENYRLAIRLHYLMILQKLEAENYIQYSKQKTNSDYIQEVKAKRNDNDFTRITRHFEYVWYGQFPLQKEEYESIEIHCLTFKRSL
ncbi:MAG: hypothetical protein RIQ62_455 [Bacteroidota bacterium]